MSQEHKKPKHRPGRLGQHVDRSVKMLASWPVQDRRSVEVRRRYTVEVEAEREQLKPEGHNNSASDRDAPFITEA